MNDPQIKRDKRAAVEGGLKPSPRNTPKSAPVVLVVFGNPSSWFAARAQTQTCLGYLYQNILKSCANAGDEASQLKSVVKFYRKRQKK